MRYTSAAIGERTNNPAQAFIISTVPPPPGSTKRRVEKQSVGKGETELYIFPYYVVHFFSAKTHCSPSTLSLSAAYATGSASALSAGGGGRIRARASSSIGIGAPSCLSSPRCRYPSVLFYPLLCQSSPRKSLFARDWFWFRYRLVVAFATCENPSCLPSPPSPPTHPETP